MSEESPITRIRRHERLEVFVLPESAADGCIDTAALSATLAGVLSKPPVSVQDLGHAIAVRFTVPVGSEDLALILSTVAAHSGGEAGLARMQHAKRAAIDMRTAALITSGTFTYQTKQFSMTITSQADTLAMYTLRNEPGMTYPIVRSTKDSADQISLADVAAVEAFTAAQRDAVRSVKDAGNVLKAQVNATLTRAQVEAIIDSRT